MIFKLKFLLIIFIGMKLTRSEIKMPIQIQRNSYLNSSLRSQFKINKNFILNNMKFVDSMIVLLGGESDMKSLKCSLSFKMETELLKNCSDKIITLSNDDVYSCLLPDKSILIWSMNFKIDRNVQKENQLIKETSSSILTENNLNHYKMNYTNQINILLELSKNELASGSENGSVTVWDLIKKSIKYELRGHTKSITSMVLLNNGDLASGSTDSTIIIWDLENRSKKFTLNGHDGWIEELLVLQNGDLISSSRDESIIVWNLNSNKKANIIKHKLKNIQPFYISGLRLLNNQNDLACGFSNGEIAVRDLTTNQIRYTLQGHHDVVDSFELLQNGDLISSSKDKSIIVWDLRNRLIKYKLENDYGTSSNSIVLLTHLNMLATSSKDGQIQVWDLNRRQIKYKLDGHSGNVNSLIRLSNGNLASGSDDGSIFIWNF